MMLSLVAGAVSVIPSIIKLFDGDSRNEGVKELTGKVVKEASKALGVEPTKEAVIEKVAANPEELLKLREIELKYATDIEGLRLEDRKNARDTSIKRQGATDWLVRNTGSMIALGTVLFAFGLDVYILHEVFTGVVTELNPVVTLIAGYSTAKASQVLGFYFGDSKASADKSRA